MERRARHHAARRGTSRSAERIRRATRRRSPPRRCSTRRARRGVVPPRAGIALTVRKELPLSGGQGGSAASAVAGAVAANALLGVVARHDGAAALLSRGRGDSGGTSSRQHRALTARRDRARPIARSDRRRATADPRRTVRRARASVAAAAHQRGARRAADVAPARRRDASDGAGRRRSSPPATPTTSRCSVEPSTIASPSPRVRLAAWIRRSEACSDGGGCARRVHLRRRPDGVRARRGRRGGRARRGRDARGVSGGRRRLHDSSDSRGPQRRGREDRIACPFRL